MTERGIVVRVEGGIAGVRLSASSCASCGGCAGVGPAEERTLKAVNRTGRALRAGDEVEVEIHTGRAVLGGFLILVLPLLLFLLFYGGASLAGIRAEGLRLLGGLAGVGAGLLATLAGGKRKKAQELPEIVRILDGRCPANPSP